MFGTLDTWLIYKLTNNKTFVTDITNASATGFFDPFTLEWGSWAIKILKIPNSILPLIVDNDYQFGTTDVFGTPIKISTVVSLRDAGKRISSESDLSDSHLLIMIFQHYKISISKLNDNFISVFQLADQSAAMLGSCCFNKNDLKVTIGTGAFINENTGENINCQLDGIYPLVGWKFNGKITYINEAPCSDGGSLIEWLKVAGKQLKKNTDII